MTDEYSSITRQWNYTDGPLEVRLRRYKVLGSAQREELRRAYAQMWQQQAQLERDARLISQQRHIITMQQRELAHRRQK